MDHAISRWIVFCGGLLAAGAAGWIAVPWLASARGVPGPGILDASSPAAAALAVLAVVVAVTVVAMIVARLLNPVVGMFILGCGVGIVSMRSGTIRDACFDGGSLVPLGVESLVLGVLLAGASVLVHLVSTPMSEPPGSTRRLEASSILSSKSLQVAAIGAVAIVGVWLLLTSPLKGQAIGAAAIGGLLAGHVAKRAAPGHEPVLLFAVPVIAVGLLQIVLAWSIADPAAAFVRGAIPNLVAVMPLDLAAGTLVGVAVGVGMSRPVPTEPAPRAAAA